MCLRKTHDEPRIAQDDIEVWKVLTIEGLSPFHDYPYHSGVNKPFEQKTMSMPVEQQTIEDGYLHACKHKEKAEALASVLSGGWARGYFIMENAIQHVVQRMLIPKGTAYYEGDDDDICAECLYWPEEKIPGLFKR